MAVRLLTPKREKWAMARKDIVFKGAPLRYPITLARYYEKALLALINRMTKMTAERLDALFQSEASHQHFAQDASLGSQARIIVNELANRFETMFKQRSQIISQVTAENADKESAKALKNSLYELSGGLTLSTDLITSEITDIVKASIANSASLIRTIPEIYFSQIKSFVYRSIAQPNTGGLAELMDNLHNLLNERAKQIHNKARNLALDQTRKMYNNINAARMKALGINKFEWVHSRGAQKPRPLHLYELNGNIYSFDDLPIIEERTGERGIPGQAINCGCVMAPVLRFDNG